MFIFGYAKLVVIVDVIEKLYASAAYQTCTVLVMRNWMLYLMSHCTHSGKASMLSAVERQVLLNQTGL